MGILSGKPDFAQSPAIRGTGLAMQRWRGIFIGLKKTLTIAAVAQKIRQAGVSTGGATTDGNLFVLPVVLAKVWPAEGAKKD